MSELWNAFKSRLKHAGNKKDVMSTGDFTSGVVHLRRKDAEELYRIILDFAEAHSEPGVDTFPWEYGLVAFPHAPSGCDGPEEAL